MMNKRGSHVGVILSFLIFVTFIAFLYSVTEPALDVGQDKLDFLEYIKVELIENFTADLSTVLIDVQGSGSNCMRFDGDDFSGVEEWNVVAKNQFEKVLGSYKQGDDVEVYENAEYVALYFSEEFDNVGSSQGCSSPSYNVEFFRTDEWVFNSTIKKLYDNMISDYDAVREYFGVPFDDNFGFTFKDGEDNIMYETSDREISGDIYSEEIPVQYIDGEANIKPGFLVVRVW